VVNVLDASVASPRRQAAEEPQPLGSTTSQRPGGVIVKAKKYFPGSSGTRSDLVFNAMHKELARNNHKTAVGASIVVQFFEACDDDGCRVL
jgi:hypothetical protein